VNIEFNNLSIPISKQKNILNDFKNLINHQDYILGKKVYKLEAELSKFTKSKYCISTSSGTDALLIALLSLNLKKGSEVLTPAFSYISSAEVIIRAGCKPVFVDIDHNTMNICMKDLTKKINKRSSAIIAVSLFGQISDVAKLKKLKKKFNISIIEDAAQSFGAQYKATRSCNVFDIGCTSFFPSKTLGCFGDGGAIFTNKKLIAERCNYIRKHGQKKKYYYELNGLNARLDTIQSIVLLEKLKNFKTQLKKRNFLASRYFFYLSNEKNIRFVKLMKNHSCVYPIFNILTKKRDGLAKFLKKNKIPTRIYYPYSLNKQKIFKKYNNNTTPISEKVSKEILSLPFHINLKESEIKFITDNIKKFFKDKKN